MANRTRAPGVCRKERKGTSRYDDAGVQSAQKRKHPSPDKSSITYTRLHNEELHIFYRLYNVVRVIKTSKLRWVGHAVRMEQGRSAYKIVTGKLEGKRPLGSP